MTQRLRDQVPAWRIAIGLVATAVVMLAQPAPWVLALGIAGVWPVGLVGCLPVSRRAEPVRRRIVRSGRAYAV